MSSPREFAASWIALQDIQENSGELEYFAGSHLLDDYLFDGRHKWMPFRSSEYRRYVDSLRARCVGSGLEHRLFRPKKGDVLVWHSDLAHGGSPIVTPGPTSCSHPVRDEALTTLRVYDLLVAFPRATTHVHDSSYAGLGAFGVKKETRQLRRIGFDGTSGRRA